MTVSALSEQMVFPSGRSLTGNSRLLAVRSGLDSLWREFGAQCKDCIVFLSFSDMTSRARVLCATGQGPDEAWMNITAQLEAMYVRFNSETHLKIDLVTERYPITWKRLKETLAVTKRNYFRFGIALDAEFKHAFLEQELNANAMLYGGFNEEAAKLNESNFRFYFGQKYGNEFEPDFDNDDGLQLFVTQGFYTSDGASLLRIEGKGLGAGHRVIDSIDIPVLDEMIKSGAQYLSSQLNDEGRFRYGWYPCFNREVHGYNTLRHASSTYSMVEVWEVFPDDEILNAIRKSFDWLVRECVKEIRQGGEESTSTVALLIDEGPEIKLGGNAVLLLALTKYSTLTGDDKYLELMEKLADGILLFQDSDTGEFVHVLHYPSLQLKEKFRIVYYDGEATFALSSYYRFSRKEKYLKAVERAFNWFEVNNYAKHRDHWIAYACEVMYDLTGDERYYRLALENIKGYLDFVAHRITAFPTLLEMMCATERLFESRDKKLSGTYTEVGKENFRNAIEARARKLLHAYFWPELAMYYKVPENVQGSFFIRHHSFRVRIDDVEHFLSAFTGYRKRLADKTFWM